jgi:hypothetical protein
MNAVMLTSYPRTLTVVAALLTLLMLAYGGVMDAVYPSLLGVFEWLETTWFGVIGKTWGAAFAFVEAVRLLGVVLTDVPVQTVVERTHRVFVFGLSICLVTGIFMACGVATKIYYLPVYWFKMLALSAGMLFHFQIRRPLLGHDIQNLNPVVVKMVAVASMLVWFMVAATGRWIGFSG